MCQASFDGVALEQVPRLLVLPRIFTRWQIQEILQLAGQGSHHDDGGHSGEVRVKPHRLPWVASAIFGKIPPDFEIRGLRPCGIDEQMQLYCLRAGGGAVSQHVDADFAGPSGSIALCSVLIYLNHDYVGGETRFSAMVHTPSVEVGGGLVFPHCLPHEGLPVLTGVKYVLKTDLLFS